MDALISLRDLWFIRYCRFVMGCVNVWKISFNSLVTILVIIDLFCS